ncbi:MAG: AAA family ATPase [Chitinophagaceae bacterium]
MKIFNSILIIGEISSGKSTLARKLSEELGIPKASFGGYLLHYCEQNNIPEDSRRDLQNLGQQMIETDPIGFLKNVIEFTTNKPVVILFEGVRHEVILKEISSCSDRLASVYIDATYDQRLSRYLSREKKIDTNKTESDFLIASKHQVEREVPALKDKCSLVIKSTDSQDEDYQQLKSFIQSWSGKP